MRRPEAPLRVVHLIASSEPTDYFASLYERTDPTRARLTIGSLDAEGPLQARLAERGVPTYALDAAARTRWPAATIAFARRLRREKVDVLHAHLLEAALVGLSAARLARTPLTVLTAHHSHEVPLHRNVALLAADAVAVRVLADVVMAPSQEMKDTLAAVHRVPAGKVTVVRHGLERDRLRAPAGAGARFRSFHGLNGHLLLGAVSRHFWIKNLESLVRAFATVAAEEPDARLVIVGGGDPAPVRRLVGELGLDDRVLLVQQTTDIASVYAAVDVLVAPARAESFGLVIAEGMAAGLPVVSTPVGIATEAIDDGTTGFLASDPTPPALAAAMRRALARRDDWAAIGAAASRSAEVYDPAQWGRDHLDVYEQRLKARR